MTVARFEAQSVRPVEGQALIIGSKVFSSRDDRRKRYREAVGVDLVDGDGVDRIVDFEAELPADMVGRFTHCECTSVLEHTRRPWLMAANIERALQPGGSLFVTVPMIWRRHDYGGDRWRLLPDAMYVLFEGVEWASIKIATSDDLLPADVKKLPSINQDGRVYIERAEVCAFGHRRAA